MSFPAALDELLETLANVRLRLPDAEACPDKRQQDCRSASLHGMRSSPRLLAYSSIV